MKSIFLVDLNKDKSKINPYLSETLIDKINHTLLKKEKVILYINKRGSYNLFICGDCSNIKKCPRCDVSLSVHEFDNKLVCHHCWYEEDIIYKCSRCWWVNLNKVWVWIQQIEKVIRENYPNLKIHRFDTDNIKTKIDKENALSNIQNSDIIIWTKMITTWFNFSKIGLIWVILLEQELQIPEYDTHEKVFFNIKQLLWRWWRVGQYTDIVIQTYSPNNESIKSIIYNNYKEFFINTLKERKIFWYPPFWEYVVLRYKNIDKNKSIDYMSKFYEKLISLNDRWLDIIFVKNVIKRNNQFFSKIIIKWNNLRDFISLIKKDILRNKDMSVIFK